MGADLGAVPRFFAVNLTFVVWVSLLLNRYADGELPSCKAPGRGGGGASWFGATGPLGMLATLLGCKFGGPAGLLALCGAAHVLNTYLALMLAATALANLSPGRTADDMSSREWRCCAGGAMLFGCHPSASLLLDPHSAFSQQHALGVLLGTTLALCSLAARLEAHWRWDNAYSAAKAVDRLEEGRARRIARYWRGEAESKGWLSLGACAAAGLCSAFALPTAGLLYVVERWRGFTSEEGDKEAAQAAMAKVKALAAAAAEEDAKEAAGAAPKKKTEKEKETKGGKPGKRSKPGGAVGAVGDEAGGVQKRQKRRGKQRGDCMRGVTSCLEGALSDGDTLQPLAWLACIGTAISWIATSFNKNVKSSGHGANCSPSEDALWFPYAWELTVCPLAAIRSTLAAGAGAVAVVFPPAAPQLVELATTSTIATDYGLLGAISTTIMCVLIVRMTPSIVHKVMHLMLGGGWARTPKDGETTVTRMMTGWVVCGFCAVLMPPVFLATIRPVAFLPMPVKAVLLGGCGVTTAQGSWVVGAGVYVAGMTVGAPTCAMLGFALSSRLPWSLRKWL